MLDIVDALLAQADRHLGVAMPGRTHLQHAQPVLLSHHLLAHVWALLRDVERFARLGCRADHSPYGSGALAGSSLGLDPEAVAANLGFDQFRRELHRRHGQSRDFAAEFAFVAR
jgi:argininosuccinate lyase